MAKVYLDSNDTFTVSNNTVEVFGATGSEVVTVAAGVHGVVLDGNVEGVVLSGSSSNYLFQQTGNIINVYTGTTLVYQAAVQDDANGTQLTFSDGTTTAAIGAGGAMTLGGTPVSATAPAPVVPGDLPPVTSVIYTIVAGATSVTEGNAVTFTVTASSAPAVDTVLTYQIAGAAQGAATAATAADFTSNTGTVTVLAGATTATFTVVPKNDGVAEGFEGFKVQLLDSGYNVSASSGIVVISDAVSPGETFTLTTGSDTTLVGGTGNDTYNGTLQFTAAGDVDATTTITGGDQLTGGAGTDTFNISVSGATMDTAGTVSTSMTGIEKVLVSNTNLDATNQGVVVDLSLADSALTTVGTTASTTADKFVTFDNVSKLTGVEMAGKGNLTVNYVASATSGTADSVTVNANGVGTSAAAPATFTTAAIEIINVVSGVDSNFLKLSADASLTTVNISGAKNITLNANQATNTAITTIDASTATGNVTVDASGFTLGNITVTGGTGTNDTFVTNQTIGASSDLADITGFETLKATVVGTVTLDAAITDLTTVNLGDTGNQTLTLATGFTGALTVIETGDGGTGDVIINTAGVALTVNGAEADINLMTIAGDATAIETLNITAGAGDTALTNITNVDVINILASATAASTAAAITDATAATGKTLTVDASALTSATATFGFAGAASQLGAVHVTGATAAANTIDVSNFAGNNIVVGGSGKDTITGGTGADSISGGAGNDTFIMGANLTAADTIDGGTGTNTLSITSFTDAAIFANVTNVQALKLTGNTAVFAPVSSISTFDLSDAGVQVLTLASGYTGATTVLETGNGAANDTIINSANVALTVNGLVADFDGIIITGGTATDTLNITADNQTADLASVTGVEAINVLQNASTATAAAVLTNVVAATGKTVTIDASNMTNASATFGLSNVSGAGSFVVTAATAGGAIDLSGASGSNTVTGGAGADTIILSTGIDSINAGGGNDIITGGTNLKNTDFIDGGAGTADTLTATVTGLTSTTGALNIANVETVTLTATAAATVKATAITGADLIAFVNNTAGAMTVTGLGANATVGLGSGANTFTQAASFALTTATGTADVLNIKLNTTAAQSTGVITTTGIETLNISENAVATGTQTLNLTGSTAATINVAGTLAKLNGQTLALGTLNAAAATVDASGITDATSTFTMTGANTTAMTISATAGINNITGGAGNDTITIASGFNSDDTVAGGAGNDTLTATVDGTFGTTLANVSAVEYLNMTVGASATAITLATVGALDGAALKTFTVTGINPTTALVVTGNGVASTGTNLLTSFDASGYAGVVDVKFDGVNSADNLFLTGNTIKGGSGATDIAHMQLGAITLTNPTISGFEKFEVSANSASGIINFTNATGLTNVIVTGTTSTTISGLAAGVAVDLGLVAGDYANEIGTTAADATTVAINLASISGAADALTVNLVDQSALTSGITIAATGVENFTFNESAVASTGNGFNLLVTDTNASNAVTFTLTGGLAGETVSFASGGIQANVTSINASAGLDNFVMSTGSRVGTSAMTITGGAGNDTIILKNTSDVLDAGAGTNDSLKVLQNAVLGGFQVDLSSTVDQITTYNGSANTAIQKGFENIDLSGVTGVFGADITGTTGVNIIVGTLNGDVINSNGGADIITGGQGGDTITTSSLLAVLNVAAGDTSMTLGGSGNSGTVTGYDTVNGFVLGTGSANSQQINVAGTGALATAGASVDGTDSSLTVGGEVVGMHTVSASGVVTFKGATDGTGNTIAVTDNASLAAIVQYLEAQDIGSTGSSVIFTGTVGAVAHTYVFTQGTDAGLAASASSDTLLDLVGVTATSIITANANTASALFIA